MTAIGKTRQAAAPAARGVLHRIPVGEFAHGRVEPPPDLADRIEHFWSVHWNLAGLPPQVQETLPHPNVHLVVEPGESAAWGVHTGRWTRVLGKDPVLTHIVIDEVDTDNWGWQGKTTTEIRSR